MLGLARRRPEPACPAAWPQRRAAARRVRLEPVGPLPTGLLTERGAELLEAHIRRRQSKRPASAPLMAGVLDVVIGRVDLAGPGQRVLAADVVASEPPRVHLPSIEMGTTVDEPFCDAPPHTAGAGESVRRTPRRPRSRAPLWVPG